MMPKRVKHRKMHRGRIRGIASRGNSVVFGDFGLQALEPGWISARNIEAGRVACNRNAPEAKMWIRVFPQKSVTSRPAETRQGKGKGDIDSLIFSEKAIQSNDEQEVINFLNDVELKGAKVYSVDTTTDAGLRVTGLGGIISLLRFSVEG